MDQPSKYRQAGRTISEVERGERQSDAALAVLSGLTFGVLSGAQPIMDRLIEKRREALRNLLIEDFGSGVLSEEEIIEEDALASFVLRLARAAVEGVAIGKLRLMSDYFRRAATKDDYKDDDFQTTASIIEQLTDDELRSLAVLSHSIKEGKIARPDVVRAGGGAPKPPTGIIGSVTADTSKLFKSDEPFRSATTALIRFGFIDLSSTFGANALSATDRLFDFLEKVDIEKWTTEK